MTENELTLLDEWISITAGSGMEIIHRDLIARTKAITAQSHLLKSLQWVSPKDKMPPDQKRVAVIVEMENNSWWTAMAEHISPKTIKSEDYLSDSCESGDLDEYDNEKDCFWVKENWFESNLFSEDNFVIDRPILFWAEIEKPIK